MEKQCGSRAASLTEILHPSSKNHEEESSECDFHEELPEVSSEEAADGPGSEHVHQKGEMVQVFSRTAKGWVAGQVVEPVRNGCITIEFAVPSRPQALFRKHVLPTSDQLRSSHHQSTLMSIACTTDLMEYDPGAPIGDLDPQAIRFMPSCALHDFVISFENLPGENMQRLTQFFHLDGKGNNSWKASRRIKCLPKTRFPVSGPFTIAYSPCLDEAKDVDIVLKVHLLPEGKPDKVEHYAPVDPFGFVHTLLDNRNPVPFIPKISGSFYLGFTVNRNLSTDLQKKMGNPETKRYYERLFERFKETWNLRGDARGENLAEEADYLISYTGWDKDENEAILHKLATFPHEGPHNENPLNPRPIKFCTDRSLGFGVHFHHRSGEVNDDLVTLNLGKHGFAQPLKNGTWFDQYKEASTQTKCGILILQTSDNYLSSSACVREFKECPAKKWCLRGNQDEWIRRVESFIPDDRLGHIPLAYRIDPIYDDEAGDIIFTLTDRDGCMYESGFHDDTSYMEMIHEENLRELGMYEDKMFQKIDKLTLPILNTSGRPFISKEEFSEMYQNAAKLMKTIQKYAKLMQDEKYRWCDIPSWIEECRFEELELEEWICDTFWWDENGRVDKSLLFHHLRGQEEEMLQKVKGLTSLIRDEPFVGSWSNDCDADDLYLLAKELMEIIHKLAGLRSEILSFSDSEVTVDCTAEGTRRRYSLYVDSAVLRTWVS